MPRKARPSLAAFRRAAQFQSPSSEARNPQMPASTTPSWQPRPTAKGSTGPADYSSLDRAPSEGASEHRKECRSEARDCGVDLLVAWVGVRDGGDGIRVPGEPLREEEVLGRPVDVRDSRVAERVEVVGAIEPRDPLPVEEDRLEASAPEAPAHGRLEERRVPSHGLPDHLLRAKVALHGRPNPLGKKRHASAAPLRNRLGEVD